MKYLKCPNCDVQYPEERIYTSAHDKPEEGKQYTISCAVCGHQFDVAYRKNWMRRLKAEVRG